MISQLFRDIFRGFGRSIGWKLGALVVLAVLAFFGGEARAQVGPNDPNNTACSLNEGCNQAEAMQACMAHGNAWVSAVFQPGTYTGPNCVWHNPETLGQGPTVKGAYKCSVVYTPNGNTITCGAVYHYVYEMCPNGTIPDAASGTCKSTCESAPPLPSGTFVQDAATLTSVCKDGCGYAPSSSLSITPCKTVDGVEYCRVDGWETNSEIHCAADGSSNNSFGTPPSDGDGDGASDGNDGSPNNPGAGGGGNEDSGGSDNNNDGDESDDGEGDGNGNTSGGGGDCATPPHSTGNAILANILLQNWKVRCALESSKNGDGSLKVKLEGASGPVGGGTDMTATNGLLDGIKGTLGTIKDFFTGDPGQGATTGEDATAESVFTENEFGADGLDDSGFGYGGSCPPPVDIPVMGNTLTFRTDILCDWLAIGGWFVMLLTGVACLRSISEA